MKFDVKVDLPESFSQRNHDNIIIKSKGSQVGKRRTKAKRRAELEGRCQSASGLVAKRNLKVQTPSHVRPIAVIYYRVESANGKIFSRRQSQL